MEQQDNGHIYISEYNVTANGPSIFRHEYVSTEYETKMGDRPEYKNKNSIVINKTHMVEMNCIIIIKGCFLNITCEEVADMIKATNINELDEKIMNIIGCFVIVIVKTSKNIKKLACYVDYISSINMYKNNCGSVIGTDPSIGKQIPRGCKYICGDHGNRVYKNMSKIFVPRIISINKKIIDHLKDSIYSNLIIYSAEYDNIFVNNENMTKRKKICNSYCTKLLREFCADKMVDDDDCEAGVVMDFYPLYSLFFLTKENAESADQKSTRQEYDKFVNGISEFKINKDLLGTFSSDVSDEHSVNKKIFVYPLLNFNVLEIMCAMSIAECNFESLCD